MNARERQYEQLMIASIKLILFAAAMVVIGCFLVSEIVGLFE